MNLTSNRLLHFLLDNILHTFSQDYNLASHTSYVACFNFIHKWRDLQSEVDSERQIFEKLFVAILFTLMVFSFLPKKCAFYFKKCALYFKKCNSCLFLKNVSPSKRVICFILNNLHFPMVEGIAFYALYKSRRLIIPCKAGLPDDI